MSERRQHLKFTVEEILLVLMESEQPGVSTAAVRRKHGVLAVPSVRLARRGAEGRSE